MLLALEVESANSMTRTWFDCKTWLVSSSGCPELPSPKGHTGISALMTPDPTPSSPSLDAARRRLEPLHVQVARVLVGQRLLVDRLLIGLLTGGHLLLEGVPGLAKTLAVRTLARALRLSFKRIQVTPDLLPAALLGTQTYNPPTGGLQLQHSPVF